MKYLRPALIALVMFLIMTCSLAEAAEKSKDYTYNDKVEVLETLNIITENDVSEETETLTRAQFVYYVSKMLKISESVDIKANYYKDVTNHWANNIINYFAENGYVSGNDDNMFYPDDKITGMQAYKIILNVLRYGVLAEQNGGFPTGYVTVADRLRLYKIDLNNFLTYEDAVNLLFDTAEIPFYDIISVENGNVTYSNDTGNTIFSVYYDIYSAYGFVSSTNGISFSEDKLAPRGNINIDGEIYSAENAGYTEKFLGRNVKALYYDNKNETKEIMFIDLYDDDTLVINAENIDNFDSKYALTYYTDSDKERKKSVNVSKGVAVNCNGALIAKDIQSLFNNIENGYVYLTDKDNNGVYEYAVIKSYKNFVVGFVDMGNEIIYDKLTNQSFNLSEIDNVNIYTTDFEKTDITLFKENMVLSVAASGSDYLEIFINNVSVTDKVSVINIGDDTGYITVGNKEYPVNKSYKLVMGDIVKIGYSYTFYINMYGEISYIKTGTSDYIYGFLINATESDIESTVKIKLFGQDSVMHFLDTEKSVKIDGVRCNTPNKILTHLQNADNTTNIRLIRYKLNEEGKLIDIDLGSGNEHNTLTESIQVDDSPVSPDVLRSFSQGVSGIARIGMSTLINSNTIIFYVPYMDNIKSGNYSEQNFKIGSSVGVVPDVGYKFNAYKTDTLHVYEDAIVIYDDGNTYYDDNTNIMLVDEITTSISDWDEVVKKITGMRDGKMVSISISNDYQGSVPESGDTIAITTDAKNEIIDIIMIYDYSKGSTPTSQGNLWASDGRYNNSTNFSQKFQCTFGYVTLKDGTAIEMSSNVNDDYLTHYDEVLDTGAYKITVYDNSLRKDKAYLGTIGDIKDANSVGIDECSRIIVHYRQIAVKDIIVYK